MLPQQPEALSYYGNPKKPRTFHTDRPLVRGIVTDEYNLQSNLLLTAVIECVRDGAQTPSTLAQLNDFSYCDGRGFLFGFDLASEA